MIDGLSRGLLVFAPAKHPWSSGRVTTPDTRNINWYYCSPLPGSAWMIGVPVGRSAGSRLNLGSLWSRYRENTWRIAPRGRETRYRVVAQHGATCKSRRRCIVALGAVTIRDEP